MFDRLRVPSWCVNRLVDHNVDKEVSNSVVLISCACFSDDRAVFERNAKSHAQRICLQCDEYLPSQQRAAEDQEFSSECTRIVTFYLHVYPAQALF